NIVRENVQDILVRRRVNLPGNSASLKLFGHGRIGEFAEERRAICDQRLKQGSAMLSSRVDGSRHGVETVRIRGADHRAEIVVAYREGVSDGVVKRKVGTS